MTELPDKVEHLEWAIESRAANQRACLKLLKLFNEHPQTWNTKKLGFAAQDLVAVGFSLWRAAFLAERTGQREAVFSDAKKFLMCMIEDNSIAYVQDKRLREWTFNYYTRSARFSLQNLHDNWPGAVEKYAPATRTPTDRWEYCQELLERAVDGFAELIRAQKAATAKLKKQQKARADRKQERKTKRRTVRKLVLAKRRSKGSA